MTAELLFEQALNGLSFGALLFILAAGLSLVFGMMDVVNLAHGAFYMLGAYVALSVVQRTGSFWLALVVAPLALGILGVILEPLLLRRLRGHVRGRRGAGRSGGSGCRAGVRPSAGHGRRCAHLLARRRGRWRPRHARRGDRRQRARRTSRHVRQGAVPGVRPRGDLRDRCARAPLQADGSSRTHSGRAMRRVATWLAIAVAAAGLVAFPYWSAG